MIYQLTTLMREVRIVMDKNMTSTALRGLGDVDTLSVDDIIKSRIVDAARRVELQAPLHYLENGHNFGDNIYWEQGKDRTGCGWTLLPSDFMRLMVFQMSDWKRPVFQAISPTEEEYALQWSQFSGIRGNTEFPVCAISVRPEGKALEFFSCKDNTAEIVKAVYLPEPKIDSDEGIDICERCHDAIVYMIASLSFYVLGEKEQGDAMAQLSQNLIQ